MQNRQFHSGIYKSSHKLFAALSQEILKQNVLFSVGSANAFLKLFLFQFWNVWPPCLNYNYFRPFLGIYRISSIRRRMLKTNPFTGFKQEIESRPGRQFGSVAFLVTHTEIRNNRQWQARLNRSDNSTPFPFAPLGKAPKKRAEQRLPSNLNRTSSRAFSSLVIWQFPFDFLVLQHELILASGWYQFFWVDSSIIIRIHKAVP